MVETIERVRSTVHVEDRIQSIRVRAERIAMPEPHRTASGVITESPLVMVDLATAEGIVGHSAVFTYTSAALKPVADLVANLEPFVKDAPLAPAALTRSLLARLRLLGSHGLVGMAIAAIDMAAWDALARARGVALCRLLGGVPRPIRAYGGIGYDGAKESARVAERWAKAGLLGVKAKIGYPSVEEDLAVIHAIRSAVGPRISVMVDYNQSLSPAEAARRLARLDGEGLEWIEEPVLAEDYAAMARLARETATPIQAGENWWGPVEFAKAIDAGASDLLMPDAMKVYGITGWMDVAAHAAARGLPISNHLFCEVSAQLLAATPTADWLEYADWWNPVMTDPLEVRGGYAVPADRPGSGVDWK